MAKKKMKKAKKKKEEIDQFLSCFDFQVTIIFKHYMLQKKPLAELSSWLVQQSTFNGFEIENKFDSFILTVESGSTYNMGLLNEKIQELFPEADWDE